MVSFPQEGSLKARKLVYENLFSINDACYFGKFGGFVIFTAVNTRPITWL